MSRIAIIGAGISGLSCAHDLLKSNYQVDVISKEFSPHTTSDKAGAIWFPYKAGPKERVAVWSKYSYHHYQQESINEDSGISMVDFLYLNAEEKLWWKEAVPVIINPAAKHTLPSGYQEGYMVHVPFIDTSVYMPYLTKQVEQLGANLVQKDVNDVYSYLDHYSAVINCTGLASRELVSDPELYPIRGHINLIEKIVSTPYITDDEGPNSLAYIFPRTNDCVLGGTAEIGVEEERVDPLVVDQLIARCQNIAPQLTDISSIKSYVGIRPGRNLIRLEKEEQNNLIHNYGHGGSGFTVAWGCARSVLELVQNIITP